jgi:nitroreductase
MSEFLPAFAVVEQVLRTRHSTRRFLSTPVTQQTVAKLLELAARAPSNANVQPWQVYALGGAARHELSAALLAQYEAGKSEGWEYDYYPQEWREPWLSRRRALGYGLYRCLGIAKGDKARMQAQTGRNFLFFDAPVGLIFTLPRYFGRGALLDYGIFISHLLVAAQAEGLATCVQTAFADYPQTMRRVLNLDAQEMVVGGLALGYADPNAPENRLVTQRESVAAFARFDGF